MKTCLFSINWRWEWLTWKKFCACDTVFLIFKNHKVSLMEKHVQLLGKVVSWLSMIPCSARLPQNWVDYSLLFQSNISVFFSLVTNLQMILLFSPCWCWYEIFSWCSLMWLLPNFLWMMDFLGMLASENNFQTQWTRC